MRQHSLFPKWEVYLDFSRFGNYLSFEPMMPSWHNTASEKRALP